MTASNKRKFVGSLNRYRLALTLGVGGLMTTESIIYVNFNQLRQFQRDKSLEAAIHRDFQELLAITEKRMNKKIFAMAEDVRGSYPTPDCSELEKEVKLDEILQKNRYMSDAFLFQDGDLMLHSQRRNMDDKYYREQHEHMSDNYRVWFK